MNWTKIGTISAIQLVCITTRRNVHRFQFGDCEVNDQTAKFNSLIILFVVILNYTHPECHISAVFLHLSEQCLDEGGLASSNLTHHSHQLTWLHAKVNSVCDKVTTSPQLQVIFSASFNKLHVHSWKGSSHIHVHVNRLSIRIQWHSWNVEYCLSI